MLGIIGAMPMEVKYIVSCMKLEEEHTISGMRFWVGSLKGTRAVVGLCGVGKVCAAVCAQVMITTFGATAMVNTGVAGGLEPKISQCDMVVATGFIQHDIDTTCIGDPMAYVSCLKQVLMPADIRLTAILTELAGKNADHAAFTGTVVTGDQFIASREKSAQLRNDFGASACDMEGGAIAQVCCMAGIPFAAARCISDNADGSAGMSYDSFAPIAAELCGHLLLDFAEAYADSIEG